MRTNPSLCSLIVGWTLVTGAGCENGPADESPAEPPTAALTVAPDAGGTRHPAIRPGGVGDRIRSAAVTVGVAAAGDEFFVDSPVVKGGSNTVGTISLGSPAPAAGVTVRLSASNANILSVPTTITVPAGQTSAIFDIHASVPLNDFLVTLSATFLGATHTVDMAIIGPVPGNAPVDVGLKVPMCPLQVASCDTGSIISGRSNMKGGPEVNTSNTLRNSSGVSCVDGTEGLYYNDESLEGLKVATVDGTPLAPGKMVTVTAKVFVFDAASDFLDIFVADDTGFISSWNLVSTVQATFNGPGGLSATFRLPTTGGAVQAVRAQWRYLSTADPCSEGFFNDRDDLAFAVAPIRTYIEAENALPNPAPMQVSNDTQASGGKFIQVQTGKNSTGAAPTDGRAKLTFLSRAAVPYKVWGRVKAPDTGSDSFWVRFDAAATWINWGLAAGASWHWVQIPGPGSNGTFTFTATAHNLEVAYREDGAQLDRVLITNDLAFVPTGTGP
jgi:hypothetical protein